MLFLEQINDLATIAASSQALVGRVEHEVNDLLHGAVAASCVGHGNAGTRGVTTSRVVHTTQPP
jgi:hypothetical protein